MRMQTRAAAAVLTAGLLTGPAAFADPTYPPVAPSGGTIPVSGGGGGAVVAPVTGGGGTQSGGGLPRTGQDVALLSVVGVAALVAGAGVVVALRRPRAPSLAQVPQDDTSGE